MKTIAQAKTYRLNDDDVGLSYVIKSGSKPNLLVENPNDPNGYRVPIRHCPAEKSIYMEEQSNRAGLVPIIFEQGYLELGPHQKYTQDFLDAHPDNMANGGRLFELVDDEMEAGEELELEDIATEAKMAIKDKLKEKDGIYAVEAIASALLGSAPKAQELGPDGLRRYLNGEINRDPRFFADESGRIDIFERDDILIKHMVLRALSDNVIKKSPNQRAMMWVKENSVIIQAPNAVDLVDFFVDWLMTDDGMIVIEEIRKRS